MIYKFFIIGIVVLFLFLVLKNPYLGTNIISDFVPFPDAIIYAGSAQNLALGKGLNLVHEGIFLPANIPFLYPLFLVPFYYFFKDPRSYYFANLLLSFGSLGLFYLILKKLKLNSTLIVLSFFVFATSSIMYWYPLLAMSENLFLFLFLLSIFLLLSKINYKYTILSGLLAVLIYATKYIGIFVAAAFGIAFFLSIFSKKKHLIYFFSAVVISLLIFDMVELVSKGGHVFPLSYLFELFMNITNSSLKINLPIGRGYLAFANVGLNFSRYLAGVMGSEITIAGWEMPIISPVVGMIGLTGLFANMFQKNKILPFYLFISSVSVFVFCLFFYLVEGRYIFFIVPALIISFAVLINNCWKFFEKINKKYLVFLTALVLGISVVFLQVNSILKYLEDQDAYKKSDRNYPVVLMLNGYFQNSKNTVVISSLPPYLFDFYKRSDYKLLPLSKAQVFMDRPELTWGAGDYSNLISLYKKYLNSGYLVYLSAFKTDPQYIYYFDFLRISNNFNPEKVAEGCGGRCDLYKINLK